MLGLGDAHTRQRSISSMVPVKVCRPFDTKPFPGIMPAYYDSDPQYKKFSEIQKIMKGTLKEIGLENVIKTTMSLLRSHCVNTLATSDAIRHQAWLVA